MTLAHRIDAAIRAQSYTYKIEDIVVLVPESLMAPFVVAYKTFDHPWGVEVMAYSGEKLLVKEYKWE